MKILIVDDEPAICESISRNLQRVGFVIVAEQQGKRAIRLIKKEKPDIVILDLVLKDMDGLQLLKNIKQLYPDMIVIAISAHKDDSLIELAKQERVDDFLSKPFKAEELRQTIKHKIEQVLLKKDKMIEPVVLVADDSDDYRREICKFITQSYKVELIESKDGQSAVQIIKDRALDLLILDIKMPGQNGLDVLNEIKDILPLANVIVLSGWSDHQVMLKAMNSGVFAFISKSDPNIFDELKEKIESVLIRQGKLIQLKS